MPFIVGPELLHECLTDIWHNRISNGELFVPFLCRRVTVRSITTLINPKYTKFWPNFVDMVSDITYVPSYFMKLSNLIGKGIMLSAIFLFINRQLTWKEPVHE